MAILTMFRKKVDNEKAPALATVAVYYKVERASGRLCGYATLSAAEAAGFNHRYAVSGRAGEPAYEWIPEAEWQRREG